MHTEQFDPTTIPSMGTHAVGTALRDLASQVRPEHAIVEIGAWLGAGTAWLAQGAKASTPSPEVHTFDQFSARPDEVRKALSDDIEVQPGTDTLPLVRRLLAPLGDGITFHKGDLLHAEWAGAAIGLYVDDAAKTPTLFYQALATFAPHWVPGETVIVLLDYRYWELVKSRRGRARLKIQQAVIEQHPHCFDEILHDVFSPRRMAAFRYTAPLPMTGIRRQAKLRGLLNRLPG